jgi:hypothetical protein
VKGQHVGQAGYKKLLVLFVYVGAVELDGFLQKVVTLKGRPSIVHPDPVSVHITGHPLARNPDMQGGVLFGTLSALVRCE